MKNFYSAREAQERLGMNEGNFFYLVRTGKIKKVVPPGKKQGVYPKSEIDKMASAIKTLIDQYDRDVSTFEVATIDDMPEEFQMDVSLYGRKTASADERIAKLKINPESDYILKNEGEIVGHISFYPVETEALQEFLNGDVEISPDKVLPFTPGRPMDILILVMSVKPGFPPDVAKHYGLRLISGALNVFKQLGERGIVIQNIYATSRTPTGIRISRKLGMHEEPMPNETGRYRFSLDMRTSDSILAKEYRQGFADAAYNGRGNKPKRQAKRSQPQS